MLHDLELDLMLLDLRLWPVHSAPIVVDGPRTAFQVRRRMLMSRNGAWDDAAHWEPVWISFGDWSLKESVRAAFSSRTPRSYAAHTSCRSERALFLSS